MQYKKEVSFEYENIDTMLKDKIQSEALSLDCISFKCK
jgi:hypothetical protein